MTPAAGRPPGGPRPASALATAHHRTARLTAGCIVSQVAVAAAPWRNSQDLWIGVSRGLLIAS